VVDEAFHLKGLITIKDIEKRKKYPQACKDALGRLRVGAAVGLTPDRHERVAELVRCGVDVIVVDTAHGHSSYVLAVVEEIKKGLWRHAGDRWQCGRRQKRHVISSTPELMR
jgi:IMP dehydrogenase